MTMLHAHLLGGLALAWNKEPLATIPSSSARSLFAYLLTYGDRPHTRDLLAGTFWPDVPDATARRRLSQALWQIRRTLDPHPVLVTQGDTVQLNPDLPLWLDVKEFKRHYAQCTNGGAEALDHFEVCLDLYRGGFLAGYYDDWVVLERERLREMLLEALGRLVEAYKSRGEYERALVYARRLASEDLWREEAHCEVMRLCHLLGQDTEALKQFAVCRQVLAEELDVEPSPQTMALADEIAHRSGLPQPSLLPSAARPVKVPLLERPDRLPLVGRQPELAELLRQVEAVVEGSGGLTVVYGEAGVGKSRLLRELADNAQWRGVPTVWGRCYELAAPLAYQPLVETLRAALPALSEAALQPLWRAELSRLLPELTTDQELPPSLSPEEERRRLLEAIARAFLVLAEREPQLVLLEDAQWMDHASLEALRYLLPRLSDARLLIVLTARAEELTGQAVTALSAMESTRLPRHLELDRLDLAETGELVQWALNLEQPVPLFSARLYAETEGNPFFLIETLWALVEEGLLYRDEAGVWSTPWDESTEDYAEMPLPTGVVQSIERRLDRLPASLSELLNLAAVIGREIDFQLWLSASDRDEEGLLTAADELCGRGLLLAAEPDSVAGMDYAFAHDQIRRVAYRRLAPPRCRLHHRRVAQALTHLAPDQPVALAYHWTRAEVWDKAVTYHQQAGDRTQGVYANTEAVAHYSQALEALERLPESVDLVLRYQLHLAREAVYDLLGDRTAQVEDLEALEALAEALDAAPPDADEAQRAAGRRAEVALRQANYAEATGDYPKAITAVQKAIRLAQATKDIGLEAASRRQWGRTLWRRGDFEAARSQEEAALNLTRDASLRRLEAQSLRDLGRICFYQGDYAGATEFYRRSLRLCREIGDRQGEWNLLNNLGVVSRNQGAYERARQYQEQALQICREIGDRRGEGMALNNLGLVSRRLGDYAKAKGYHEQALCVGREIGDRWNEGQVLTNLGISFYYQGDYGQARTYFEQAAYIWREIGNRHGEGGALANLGCLSRHLGEYAKARPFFEESLRIFCDIGDRKTEGVVLCDLSLLLHYLGDAQAAKDCSQRALIIAQDLGDRPAQGHALTNLGHAEMGLNHLAEAAAAYQQAVDLRYELGEHHLAMDSLAGMARVSLVQSDLDSAKSQVEKILTYLETGTLDGTEQPLWIYLTCYQILRASQDLRAQTVLNAAHHLLQEQAAKIADEELRHSFLEKVAAHREIGVAYQELQAAQQGRQITVSLPRTDAPLGRPLRKDEYVIVTWTVAAPEDKVVARKVERRRRCILRLLNEARAQGAAPRDQDLAEVLGVSLTTLRRDMAALRAQGHRLPTRWRKMTT
jgi:predicted ATPase/DNA-binding SARP family transcriptional activator